MFPKKIAGICVLLIAFQAEAESPGNTLYMKGNSSGAAACMACHGQAGEGNAAAGFPSIAGLNSAYIKKQLADYAAGSRNNPVMAPVAKALSEAEAAQLADYIASMTVPKSGGISSADPALLASGQKLVERGDWSRNMPECTACHGKQLQGIGAYFPALAGQHANYISQQLLAWQKGNRSNDPNELMKSVADKLSAEEINAVSAYLASLPSGQ